MSIRYEWTHVSDLGFYVEPEGAEIGDDVVDEDNLALVLGPACDGAGYVIEGTQEQLVQTLRQLLVVVEGYDPEDEEWMHFRPARVQTIEVAGDLL